MVGWSSLQDNIYPHLDEYPSFAVEKHFHTQKEVRLVQWYLYVLKASASRRTGKLCEPNISLPHDFDPFVHGDVCMRISRKWKSGIHSDLGKIVSCTLYLVIRKNKTASKCLKLSSCKSETYLSAENTLVIKKEYLYSCVNNKKYSLIMRVTSESVWERERERERQTLLWVFNVSIMLFVKYFIKTRMKVLSRTEFVTSKSVKVAFSCFVPLFHSSFVWVYAL